MKLCYLILHPAGLHVLTDSYFFVILTDSNMLNLRKKYHFATPELSTGELELRKLMNARLFEIIQSQPENLKNPTALYFLENSGGLQMDFFCQFYPPTWSILHWLKVKQTKRRENLPGNDSLWTAALTAHAMSLFLHSLDNHLVDGQTKASHLILELRTRVRERCNQAVETSGAGLEGAADLYADLMNEYYGGVHNPPEVRTLDEYLELTRQQAASCMVAPMLLAMRFGEKAETVQAVRRALEAFALAFRLMDDIHDIKQDARAGKNTAVRILLSREDRAFWDRQTGNVIDQEFESCMEQSGALRQILERLAQEMQAGAETAREAGLGGYAEQLLAMNSPVEKLLTNYHPGLNSLIWPDQLGLELTTACDNAKGCNYCFALADLPGGPGHMPFERAREASRVGYEMGFRRLHLTGGEPTIWPGFFDLLDYAYETGYQYILVNTHAMAVNAEFIERATPYRDRLHFTVTLNGPRELHDETRGPGAREKTDRGIEALLQAAFKVEIFTVVTAPLLEDFVNFVRDVFQDFPDVTGQTLIQMHRVSSDTEDVTKYMLSPQEFIQMTQLAGGLQRFAGGNLRFLRNPLTSLVAGTVGLPLPPTTSLVVPDQLAVLAKGRYNRSTFQPATAGAGSCLELKRSLSFQRTHKNDDP